MAWRKTKLIKAEEYTDKMRAEREVAQERLEAAKAREHEVAENLTKTEHKLDEVIAKQMAQQEAA